MTRRVAVLGLALAVLLAGCTVPRPKGDQQLRKVAATQADARRVLDQYTEVLSIAAEALDPKPLAAVEAGSMLEIDSGTFEVAQQLEQRSERSATDLRMLDVHAPMRHEYPLWFLMPVDDPGRERVRVQVWRRERAAEPWKLVAAPETVADAELPALSEGPEGTVVVARRGDPSGLGPTPQEAAETYAAALAGRDAPQAQQVVVDAFVEQMWSTAEANGRLKGVRFRQQWRAQDVEVALRTRDGGSLVLATLERRDGYRVAPGRQVTWPSGSPQQAFLAGGGISSSGTLRYLHQVLLHVPGDGGPVVALGQLGGVTGADVG